MKKSIARFAAVALLTLSGSTAFLASAAEKEEDEKDEKEAPALTEASIPAPVMATVKSNAPGAAFVKAELEDEDGTKVYEVKVKTVDGLEIEVMVRPDGQLTEIEEKVKGSALSGPVAKTAKHLLAGGEVKGIEKATVVVYEVKKEIGEATYELSLDANGNVRSLSKSDEESEEGDEGAEAAAAEATIPAAAMATAKLAVPGGVFEKATIEDEDGAKTYEVKMKLADGREVEAMVRADGQLTETEEQVTEASLPAVVAQTLKDVLPAGKVVGLEKKTVVLCEVKKEIGDATYEMVLNANGGIESIKAEYDEEGEESERGEKKEKGEKEEDEEKESSEKK